MWAYRVGHRRRPGRPGRCRGGHALLAPYVTDVQPVERAQDAFELAVNHVVGQLKDVLTV